MKVLSSYFTWRIKKITSTHGQSVNAGTFSNSVPRGTKRNLKFLLLLAGVVLRNIGSCPRCSNGIHSKPFHIHTSATVSHRGLIWLPSTLLLTTLFWFLRSVRTDRNTQYDILFTQMKSLLQIHLTAEWKIAISEIAVNLVLNLFRVNQKHFCSLLVMFVVLPVLIPRSCYMARWVYWDQSSN